MGGEEGEREGGREGRESGGEEGKEEGRKKVGQTCPGYEICCFFFLIVNETHAKTPDVC